MQSATEIEIERQQNADSLAAKIPAYFTLLFSLSFSHSVSLSLFYICRSQLKSHWLASKEKSAVGL